MTDKKTQMAAQVVAAHLSRSGFLLCSCGKRWTPLHVAEALDKADLLCALKTADR